MKKLLFFIALISNSCIFASGHPTGRLHCVNPDQKPISEAHFMEGSLSAQRDIAGVAHAQQATLDSIVANQQAAQAAGMEMAQEMVRRQLEVADRVASGVEGIETQLKQTNFLLALLIKNMFPYQTIQLAPNAMAASTASSATATAPATFAQQKGGSGPINTTAYPTAPTTQPLTQHTAKK